MSTRTMDRGVRAEGRVRFLSWNNCNVCARFCNRLICRKNEKAGVGSLYMEFLNHF